MSKREAALKALEALRNTDDTQTIASDDDDADFLDDDNFLDEFDEVDADVDEDSDERDLLFGGEDSEEEEEDNTNHNIIDSIESTINRVNEDQNIDKTSKIGVIWTKLKIGEDLSVRKKIYFNEKPGPTSYATRNIDNTKLSAFLMIFDI